MNTFATSVKVIAVLVKVFFPSSIYVFKNISTALVQKYYLFHLNFVLNYTYNIQIHSLFLHNINIWFEQKIRLKIVCLIET